MAPKKILLTTLCCPMTKRPVFQVRCRKFVTFWCFSCSSVHHLLVGNVGRFPQRWTFLSTAPSVRESLDLTFHDSENGRQNHQINGIPISYQRHWNWSNCFRNKHHGQMQIHMYFHPFQGCQRKVWSNRFRCLIAETSLMKTNANWLFLKTTTKRTFLQSEKENLQQNWKLFYWRWCYLPLRWCFYCHKNLDESGWKFIEWVKVDKSGQKWRKISAVLHDTPISDAVFKC